MAGIDNSAPTEKYLMDRIKASNKMISKWTIQIAMKKNEIIKM